jgi:hypothetical protein
MLPREETGRTEHPNVLSALFKDGHSFGEGQVRTRYTMQVAARTALFSASKVGRGGGDRNYQLHGNKGVLRSTLAS